MGRIRKIDLLLENEWLWNRVGQLENILCPAEQHDFVEVKRWYEPDGNMNYYLNGAPIELKTYKTMVCKRCLARTTVRE